MKRLVLAYIAAFFLLMGGMRFWFHYQERQSTRMLAALQQAFVAERMVCAQLGSRQEGGTPLYPEWHVPLTPNAGGRFYCVDVGGGIHHALPPPCNRFRLEACK